MCHQQVTGSTNLSELVILKLAVITVIAFLLGAGAGWPTFMANGSVNVAAAVLAGGGAMAAAFLAMFVLVIRW